MPGWLAPGFAQGPPCLPVSARYNPGRTLISRVLALWGQQEQLCRLPSQNEFEPPEPNAEKALNNCNKLDYFLVLVISQNI